MQRPNSAKTERGKLDHMKVKGWRDEEPWDLRAFNRTTGGDRGFFYFRRVRQRNDLYVGIDILVRSNRIATALDSLCAVDI